MLQSMHRSKPEIPTKLQKNVELPIRNMTHRDNTKRN